MVVAPLPRERSDEAVSVWRSSGAIRPLSRDLFDEKVWLDRDIGDPMSPLRVGVRDDDNRLIGFGVAVPRSVPSTTPGTKLGAIKLIAVEKSFQRRGIGTTIVSRLVDALRAAGCSGVRLGESPPNYFQPGLDESDAGVCRFFERLGWTETGRVCDMTCVLAEPFDIDRGDIERLAEGGLTARRALPEDTASLSLLLERYWAAWEPELAAAARINPPAVFVAVTQDGRVAGFAAHSANNASLGWFGPMGTDPDFRGLGIGRVLLRHCLNDLRYAGFTSCTIPWVGPVEFYERAVGARVERTLIRYHRTVG